jgi:hypothetical protein
MASLLKQRMANHQFYFPLLSWERPYRGEICQELNIQRYCIRKDGVIGYSHPTGTHDNVFWSIAIAVYATTEMQPEQFLAAIPRLWQAVNNYNQQTPKNNLTLKLNLKNKPCQKNPIGKATTTTKKKNIN